MEEVDITKAKCEICGKKVEPKCGFMPEDIFKKDNNKTNPEDIKKCFKTIKEVM